MARRAGARCDGGRNARLRSPSYGAAAFARRIAAGEGWWEVLVMLQFVCFRFCFVTPDLQSGNRITSREW